MPARWRSKTPCRSILAIPVWAGELRNDGAAASPSWLLLAAVVLFVLCLSRALRGLRGGPD